MAAWDVATQLERAGETIPPEQRRALDAKARDLLDSSIAIRSLAKGDIAEDFELPNTSGGRTRLSDLLRKGPVVVSFYRGRWCSFCSAELDALEQAFPQISAMGASLITISPQTFENSLRTKEEHGLSYEVLSDEGNAVARQFGIVFRLPEVFRAAYKRLGVDLPAYNGDQSFELPIPATYVISPDRTIADAYVNPDYTERMAPAQIIATLNRMREALQTT